MAICLKCGREQEACLCSSCKSDTDIESLCYELITYKYGFGTNALWNRLSSELFYPNDLKNAVFAVSDDLPSPRKEYIRVICIANDSASVPKASRPWFYDIYHSIRRDEGLTERERNRLHGIALGALYMDYEYEDAEKTAALFCGSDDIPWQAYYSLAEYYTTTRRYELAGEIIADALKRFADDPNAFPAMKSLSEKNAAQLAKAEAGKQEYLPNPRENREEARRKYLEFLSSIGIEISSPVHTRERRKIKAAIPKDQYPKPVETRDTDFDTFVAFDLETTGLNPRYDSIIEIGAVRVCGGKITETAEYTFQELAKPFERRIPEDVQRLTGITAEDVKQAPEMWEVFRDFMEFAGNDILLGFNCMAFDSKFMVRAGRYANLVISNKYFDVMRYADEFRSRIDLAPGKFSLTDLSEKLGIENPEAHRALADAVTTARVFLKLKELTEDTRTSSVDDLLSDLDSW